MKHWIVLATLVLGANAFAEDQKITVKTTCNLSDFAKQDDLGNVQTETYTLNIDDRLDIGIYKGHKYQLALFDNSYGDKKRYQFIISSRDEKTNAVIGSASATFKSEVPELFYQEGGDIVLNCMQMN